MNERLGLPANLRQYGYKLVDLDEVAEDAHRSFFNHTAPYHPSKDEYKSLIREVLG